MAKSDFSNIFEPASPLGPIELAPPEYQINIDPVIQGDATAATDDMQEKEDRSFRWPLFVVMLCLAGLMFQLVNLQIARHTVFQGLAKGNQLEARILVPPRGIVVDRNGNSLVKNQPAYHLELYPAQLPKDKESRQQIYQKVQAVANIPADTIIAELDKTGLHSAQPITLKADLDRDTALTWQMAFNTLSGISITKIPARSYDASAGLAHLLGYVGKVTEDDLKERSDLRLTSLVGKSGLEAEYDRYLQGQEGKEEMEVDSKGQIQRIVASEPALPGKTVQLHLDLELQKVMAEALAEGAKNVGKTKGVAIAMDPATGGILGMVSLPTYDNNLFVQAEKKKERQSLFDNKDLPLFNRAIAGTYAPGSTVKPNWGLAALQEKLITEKTDIITPPEIRIGSSVFPDWKPHGHSTLKRAIAESNNIFMYAIGGGYESIKGLGVNRMKEYATRFGWGKPTGIDLPGEAKGLMPDAEWKKKAVNRPWTIGDTYHISIGQGDLLLTPIQLITSINALANHGTLYQPSLAQAIKDLNGATVEEFKPVVLQEKIGDPNNIRIVREGMRETIIDGTATPLNQIPMPIAGKTGTAQFEEKDKTHAWFVGFAPFDKPTMTLLVLVEGGGESFTVAVPIAKKIFTWYSENRYKPTADS